jgi:putative ABC transport system permease protein
MVFGLLRGHTSIEAASRELLAISMRLQREYPRANTGVIASPIPLREQFVGRTRPAILVLAVGVLAILLTTCANIAGLMIARSTTRARDVVIKTALGASDWHCVGSILGEHSAFARRRGGWRAGGGLLCATAQ